MDEPKAPLELRATTREQEMSIELLNGSVIQLVSAEDPRAPVGTNLKGVVFDEYALYESSEIYDYIRPILARNGGWAMFISTYRGSNHDYQLVQQNCDNPDWYVRELSAHDTVDNSGRPIVSDEMIDAERRSGMSEALIKQEFFNSPTAAFSGAYYSQMIRRLREEDRAGNYPWNQSEPVYVAFDIGYSDHTVAIFFQTKAPDQTIILGSKSWQFTPPAEIAQDIKKIFPWGSKINVAILPHDANRPGPSGDTWVSTLDKFRLALDENVANTLVRSLFLVAHAVLREHYDTPVNIKRGGRWQTATPSQWRKREHLVVRVGLSPGERTRQQMALDKLLQAQVQLTQLGMDGVLTNLPGFYDLLMAWARVSDVPNTERFFVDDRFLWLDLDTIIGANIDDLLSDAEREPLKVYWSLPYSKVVFRGMARGYNGAIVGGLLGGSPDIWKATHDQPTIDRACASFIGSDQAVLSMLRPGLLFWSPATDGITLRGEPTPGGSPWRVTLTTSGNCPWIARELQGDYERASGMEIPTRRRRGPRFLRRRVLKNEFTPI